MAGAGYKLFNTGDVLTAQQVNEYLMQQTVMVFADATARTTALSGVLAEGMLSYLKSTDATEVYNGSAWVALAADQTPLTTKGDLFTYTTADARLASSNVNGDVLTVDTSTASGLKWAAPAASGAYTQLATGTLSGTAVTLSSISQSYVDLYLTINNPVVNTGTALAYRINGVTSATYGARGIATDSTTVVGTSTQTILYANQGSNLPTSASNESAILYIRDYTKNARKTMECSYAAGANAFTNYQVGYAATTSAITTIEIRTVNGTSTFSGGTYTLYGVK